MASNLIQGADQLRYFRLCQHYYALKIEVNTGLHHSRGSVMKSAKILFGCKRNTKKGVLEELRIMKEQMEEARKAAHGD